MNRGHFIAKSGDKPYMGAGQSMQGFSISNAEMAEKFLIHSSAMYTTKNVNVIYESSKKSY